MKKVPCAMRSLPRVAATPTRTAHKHRYHRHPRTRTCNATLPPFCSKRFEDGKLIKLMQGEQLCNCTVTCHVNGLVHLDVTAEGKEFVLTYLGLIEAVVAAKLETQACQRNFRCARSFAFCFFGQ